MKARNSINSSDRERSSAVTLGIAEAQHLGLRLHRAGCLAEAEMLYRRILDIVPDNFDVLHFLAVLCHQAGRNPEAQGLIEKIISLDPKNPDAHNNYGNVMEGLERFQEAEESYRKAISLRPDHAPAFNNLGVVLAAQKRTAEAIETYRQAIALAPNEADFRYNLGNVLRRSGEIDEAIEVYREAIKLDHDHDGAWRALARCFIVRGRRKEAADAFDEWLRRDPWNEFARYMRAALMGESGPDRAPDAYICRVFDGLAASFDNHLVRNLEYRAPNLVGEALTAALPVPSPVYEILDAGCGTGLCATFLKPYAKRLSGVDLSRGMVDIAETRNAYDDLVIAELTEFLDRQTEAYDIIASSDTFCYFGPLEPVFRAAAGALKPQGMLVFTVEDAGEEGVDWRLDPTTRYSHSRSYVERALGESGFSVVSLSSAVLRKEDRQPVMGHVVVTVKADGGLKQAEIG